VSRTAHSGIAIGGFGVGGEDLKGGFATIGVLKVENNGTFRASASRASARSKDSRAVDDWARELRVGPARRAGRVINIARSNPKATRVLPISQREFHA
jgi:hypothetical protein